MRIRNLLAALAILLLALGHWACGEDNPTCVDYQLGAIEGVVTSVGQPLAGIRVIAFPKHSSSSTSEVTAITDSSGYYRLDLVNGVYWVEIQDHRGLYHFSNTRIDTVQVSSQLTRLDFPWSRAEVRIGLPPEWEGRTCRLDLASFPDFDQTSEVFNGWATFDFPLVKPETYTMKLFSGAVALTLPGAVRDSGPIDTLTVLQDAPAFYEVDLANSYASLEGRITGGWENVGGPLPRIAFFDTDSLRLGVVTPDSNGHFTIELLAPRDIVLQTQVWEGLDRWVGGSSWTEASRFSLTSGTHLTGVDIPESRIRLNLNGPGPLLHHRASVLLIDPQGQEHDLFRFGQDSPLILRNLGPGNWLLQVSGYNTAQTWAASWYPGADLLDNATPIQLGTGEGLDLTMELVPGGAISGRLQLGGYTPVMVIPCTLFSAEGTPLNPTDPWDWGELGPGSFAFQGLPDGEFYLAAQSPFSPDIVWYPGTTDFQAAQTVTITDHAQISDLVLNIPLAGKVQP